ncbi:MAG: ribonuclease P protein subunit [Candidatus Diapherotrites archaeon]|nr:ribonuclease P protein subunit [Candidatus Diapherotrites archaeon]
MIKGENYCITPENILMHEFTGIECKVIQSTDKNKKKIKGKIIKETKNTIIMETNEGKKIIPKKEVELEFKLNEEKVKVNGKKIIGKSEDRIKLNWRKKNE